MSASILDPELGVVDEGFEDVESAPRSGVPTLSKLSTAELLLVWGMRHWVACLKARTDPGPLLFEGFTKAEIAEAVRPFDQILTATLTGACAPRDVRCPGCKTVGDAEWDFLDAVALSQIDRRFDLRKSVGNWLYPAAARQSCGLFIELAAILRKRSLIVFPRRLEGMCIERRVGLIPGGYRPRLSLH
jgi:hypothetical protein